MPVPFIYKVIEAEIDLGHVVDVEKHCNVFQQAFPDLSHKEIQDVILQVVMRRGGGAVWGRRDADDLSGGGKPD